MCIVIVKPAGKAIPPMEHFKESFSRNRHGAGVMYHKDGWNRVQVRKGFMTFKDFEDFHSSNPYTEADTVVWHFRIGTAGKNDARTCHPFPVLNSVDATRLTKYTTELAMVHNGIIDVDIPKGSELSDTQQFILSTLSQRFIRDRLYTSTTVEELLSHRIGNSKLVFLNNKGQLKFINEDKGHWVDDVWYSNYSYKEVTYKHNYTTYYAGKAYAGNYTASTKVNAKANTKKETTDTTKLALSRKAKVRKNGFGICTSLPDCVSCRWFDSCFGNEAEQWGTHWKEVYTEEALRTISMLSLTPAQCATASMDSDDVEDILQMHEDSKEYDTMEKI